MEEFERALHRAVKAEGGTALAKRMGVNETRLLDCANPNRDSHRMSVEMFGQILTHLPDEARELVLNALAGEFGLAVVKKDQPKPVGLTASLLTVGKEVSDLTIAVHTALQDGHVTQIEKASIRKELAHVRSSLDEMEASVSAA
ncbi:phage regulatory CII family protein [Pseudomonas sp. AU12215]|uniref:phage regulatory CII family protein n=1 Tax=Pseudomonas sp. AU12215 TaxID=1860123 RepID=UPI0007EE4E25|nr:phage regulatory CII family protein [Pseudomonas sp. AU12215]OBY57740.1 hypothetical protein A9513_005810 [Pseudomonas sp. AU12215]